MRAFEYDVSGVVLSDCTKVVLVPMHIDTIPMVMGALQAITWRRRHVNDDSHEIAQALYQELQEVFIVNDCVTDLLAEIRDALGYLSNLACICNTTQLGSGTDSQRLIEDIYINQAHNDDVDFSGTEDANYDYGEPGETIDTERCQNAQATYHNIKDIMERCAELQLGIAGVSSSAIVALVGAFLTVPVPISIVVGLIAGLAYILLDETIQNGLAQWAAQEQEAICRIYNNSTMYGAQDDLRDLMDETIDSLAARQYIRVFYGSVLMGSMWQDNDNAGDFDGDYCLECLDIPEGCTSFLPCDMNDWTGGTLSCVGGMVQITGGSATLERDPLTVEIGTTRVRLVWTSRGTGDNQGACNVHLVRVSDSMSVSIGNTGLQDFDTVIESILTIPSWFSGSCYIKLQQANYTIEPLYWCIEPIP